MIKQRIEHVNKKFNRIASQLLLFFPQIMPNEILKAIHEGTYHFDCVTLKYLRSVHLHSDFFLVVFQATSCFL